MKILYLAHTRLPVKKAHGVQMMKSCEAFALAGVGIEFAALRRGTATPEELFAFYGVKRRFPLTLCVFPNLGATRIGYLLETLCFIIWCVVLAIRRRPDVIYSRDEKILAAMRVCGFRNLVWESHHGAWNRFAHFVTARGTLLIVTSQWLLQWYAERGVRESAIRVVVHGAIDPAEFNVTEDAATLRREFGLPAERPIVSYVGKFKTMGESKGVEELMEAVARSLSQAEPQLLLVVGLNEDELPLVRKQLERLGYTSGDYALVGHVPHAQVARYLKAADVVVMNYPDTPHYRHVMFPLKLFEYMASGTPVITTDLPSVREHIAQEDVWYVPPDDVEALARGIRSVLENPHVAKEKTTRARTEAYAHTWEARAARILDFISHEYGS